MHLASAHTKIPNISGSLPNKDGSADVIAVLLFVQKGGTRTAVVIPSNVLWSRSEVEITKVEAKARFAFLERTIR